MVFADFKPTNRHALGQSSSHLPTSRTRPNDAQHLARRRGSHTEADGQAQSRNIGTAYAPEPCRLCLISSATNAISSDQVLKSSWSFLVHLQRLDTVRVKGSRIR